LVLHGTLTTFRRRCGKPACRCASGEPHEGPALTYTERGRRYESAKADLEAAATEGIATLRTRRDDSGRRGNRR